MRLPVEYHVKLLLAFTCLCFIYRIQKQKTYRQGACLNFYRCSQAFPVIVSVAVFILQTTEPHHCLFADSVDPRSDCTEGGVRLWINTVRYVVTYFGRIIQKRA